MHPTTRILFLFSLLLGASCGLGMECRAPNSATEHKSAAATPLRKGAGPSHVPSSISIPAEESVPQAFLDTIDQVMKSCSEQTQKEALQRLIDNKALLRQAYNELEDQDQPGQANDLFMYAQQAHNRALESTAISSYNKSIDSRGWDQLIGAKSLAVLDKKRALAECPLCFTGGEDQEIEVVELPTCTHPICVDCYKKMVSTANKIELVGDTFFYRGKLSSLKAACPECGASFLGADNEGKLLSDADAAELIQSERVSLQQPAM